MHMCQSMDPPIFYTHIIIIFMSSISRIKVICNSDCQWDVSVAEAVTSPQGWASRKPLTIFRGSTHLLLGMERVCFPRTCQTHHVSKLHADCHPVILTLALMNDPREQVDKEDSGWTSSQQNTIHWLHPESSAGEPPDVLKSVAQGYNRNICNKAS